MSSHRIESAAPFSLISYCKPHEEHGNFRNGQSETDGPGEESAFMVDVQDGRAVVAMILNSASSTVPDNSP